MAMDLPLISWPKFWVYARDRFFGNQFYFPLSWSLLHVVVKCSIFIHLVKVQLVTRLLMMQPVVVPCSILKYIFLITLHILAVETVGFNLFVSLYIYLFSFFFYSCLNLTRVQLVSQCVMTEMKLLLLRNTFSEYLSKGLIKRFYILT
jgi:hypothetical protein